MDGVESALATAVSVRDLPNAAARTKVLLSKRAVKRLRLAVVRGLGEAASIDESYAQSVCEVLASSGVLPSSLLLTCMRAVRTTPPQHAGGHPAGTVVNSARLAWAMTQPSSEDLETIARTMIRTSGCAQTAKDLLQACQKSNGRDGSPLEAYLQCAMLKDRECAQGGVALLLACVRATKLCVPRVGVCFDEALDQALNASNKARTRKRPESMPKTVQPSSDRFSTTRVDPDEEALKMGLIWTYVPYRTQATTAVEDATQECFFPQHNAHRTLPEIKTIQGVMLPPVPARVSMISKSH